MICLRGVGDLGPRATLIAGLGLFLPLAATAAPPENPPLHAESESTEQLKFLKQHDAELKAARDEQRRSAEAEAALKREIEEIGSDRRKLNEYLIDTAARVRAVENKVTAIQDRLRPLDEN